MSVASRVQASDHNVFASLMATSSFGQIHESQQLSHPTETAENAATNESQFWESHNIRPYLPIMPWASFK